ncbi:MAG: hypothetical protein QW407_02695 [Thermofilaceae archaeon]
MGKPQAKYKLVKCPRCSQLFATSSIGRVKCRYCSRSFKARDHLVTVGDDLEAIREYKAKLGQARALDGLEEGLQARFYKFEVKDLSRA